VFDWMQFSPGSVPIGYALQWSLIGIAGFSNFTARLPSIAAWPLTLFAMVRIGARIGIRRREVLAVITATMPMLFRYAIEGRPYLPAFCLTAFATLLLLEFIEEPDGQPALWRLGMYGLLLAVAPLTQGTAATVTLAHGVFVLTNGAMRRDRRRQATLAVTIAISLLPPVAWSLHMREVWTAAIVHDGYTFAFSFRTAAGFLKDISGGGLAVTGLLFAAAVFGYTGSGMARSARYLLGLTVLISICGAVASDALAGYFASPRQAIYCLCGSILLAAAGWESFRSRYPTAAVLALSFFAAVSLAKDVSVVRSKEDWKAASRMLAQTIAEGYCVEPVSNLTAPLNLYSFFDPLVESHRCKASEDKVGLVYSTYTPGGDRDSAASALLGKGYAAAGERASGGTKVELYEMRP
jgi:4-amino-4-deoxy-L-arabinose transferase-like glycosyltransferase